MTLQSFPLCSPGGSHRPAERSCARKGPWQERKERKEEKKDKKQKKDKDTCAREDGKRKNDTAQPSSDKKEKKEEGKSYWVSQMSMEETFSADDTTFFKAQLKPQAQRNDIVSMRLKSEATAGKWVQKAHLVIKDGLPGWARMIIMKQVAIEAACGDVAIENFTTRRDEILKQVYQGTWRQAIHDLQQKFDHASTNKPMLRPEPGIVEDILKHNHLLPVPQEEPDDGGKITRMPHLDEEAAESSESGVPEEAAAPALPPVPAGRHADTCETLLPGDSQG